MPLRRCAVPLRRWLCRPAAPPACSERSTVPGPRSLGYDDFALRCDVLRPMPCVLMPWARFVSFRTRLAWTGLGWMGTEW